MKLEPLLTYRAELAQPVAVGAGPFGTRQIFDVTGGSFEGPKLRGKLLPSGGDWILIGPDGFGRLDVRATLATTTSACICMHWNRRRRSWRLANCFPEACSAILKNWAP
mgnify:CR=1 FL=1